MIERSLADFASGRKTGHLSRSEISEVIGFLEKRLETVKESLASVD